MTTTRGGCGLCGSPELEALPVQSCRRGLLGARRAQVKRWYFGALLGETLIAIARPSS